jgi:hypothetical protein
MLPLGRLVNIRTILLVYLLLAVAFSLVNPLFESPDEIFHYEYIRHIVDHRDLPVMQEGRLSEFHQPPLYYGLGALLVSGIPVGPLKVELNPFWGYDTYRFGTDNKNLFVHTDSDAFPYRSHALAAHLLRVYSVALGAVTILIWHVALRDVFGSLAVVFSALAIAALNPQFLFISSSISNDNLIVLIGAALMWWSIRTVRLGLTWPRILALAVLLAAALLTKLSVAALAVVPLCVLLATGTTWRRRLAALATVGAVVAVMAGWWLLRNRALYGELTGIEMWRRIWVWEDGIVSLSNLLPGLRAIWTSYWGQFGLGQVVMPEWVYGLLALTGLASLMGWALRLRRRQIGTEVDRRGLVVLAGGALTLLAALMWYALANPTGGAGRFLFPALGALASLMACGLHGLLRTDSAGREWRAAGLTFAAMLLLSAGALTGVVAVAYAPPARITIDEVRRQTQPADYRFGDTAILLGYRLDRDRVLPSEEVRVTLCWEVLSPTDTNTYFYVHVIGPENVVVARRESYPGLGRYPTVNWRPDDIFCDDVPLLIEDWARAPAVYDVAVGLVNRVTGVALTPISPAGLTLSPALVSRIKVRSPEPLERLAAERLNAKFGEEIRLLDAKIVPDALRSGEFAEVVLRWQAVGNPSDNYTVFVHVVDSGGGIIAQGDSQPQGGHYPTRFWDAGEVVTDVHRVEIPESAQSGAYDIAVGLYVLETGRRLPIAGQAVEAAHVGMLTISEEP